jgi:hypothetical protein
MDEVEEFLWELQIQALLDDIEAHHFNEEDFEKKLDKLAYEIDMYDPQRAIQRVLGRKK